MGRSSSAPRSPRSRPQRRPSILMADLSSAPAKTAGAGGGAAINLAGGPLDICRDVAHRAMSWAGAGMEAERHAAASEEPRAADASAACRRLHSFVPPPASLSGSAASLASATPGCAGAADFRAGLPGSKTRDEVNRKAVDIMFRVAFQRLAIKVSGSGSVRHLVGPFLGEQADRLVFCDSASLRVSASLPLFLAAPLPLGRSASLPLGLSASCLLASTPCISAPLCASLCPCLCCSVFSVFVRCALRTPRDGVPWGEVLVHASARLSLCAFVPLNICALPAPVAPRAPFRQTCAELKAGVPASRVDFSLSLVGVGLVLVRGLVPNYPGCGFEVSGMLAVPIVARRLQGRSVRLPVWFVSTSDGLRMRGMPDVDPLGPSDLCASDRGIRFVLHALCRMHWTKRKL